MLVSAPCGFIIISKLKLSRKKHTMKPVSLFWWLKPVLTLRWDVWPLDVCHKMKIFEKTDIFWTGLKPSQTTHWPCKDSQSSMHDACTASIFQRWLSINLDSLSVRLTPLLLSPSAHYAYQVYTLEPNACYYIPLDIFSFFSFISYFGFVSIASVVTFKQSVFISLGTGLLNHPWYAQWVEGRLLSKQSNGSWGATSSRTICIV
jgi:hypothetical protein